MSARCSQEYTNIWKVLIFFTLNSLVSVKKHSTIDALAELTERIRSSKSETLSFFLV